MLFLDFVPIVQEARELLDLFRVSLHFRPELLMFLEVHLVPFLVEAFLDERLQMDVSLGRQA